MFLGSKVISLGQATVSLCSASGTFASIENEGRGVKGYFL